MRDSEIVAAIVAGDPAGLAAAYDRYAPALHAYCRSLLAEPADAADAVQDTFVIAASRLAGLRDPDRLKPWLYAVARNECYRKSRGRAKTTGLEEAGDISDTSAPADSSASRGELRELMQDAIAGLNQGDREVIELNLRHDLDGADLADALGVKANQAHALQSRARGQLERSLGALLVARTGRASCPELAALLTGWDGHLNVLLRKRVSRHVEQCQECGQRKRRELSPAMLLSVLPLVVLPPGLRQQVLRLVADVTPDAAGYRARLARRAGRFRADGFPVSIVPAPRRRPGLAQALVAAGLLAAGGLFVLAMMLAWPARHTASATGVVPPGSSPTGLASAAATGSAPASPTGPASLAPGSGAPASSPPVTGTLPAAVSPPAGSSPAPSPTPTRTRTGKPTPAPSASAPPGTLSAAPASLTLVSLAGAPIYSGRFTLTATGGPVAKFVITVPAADAAGLAVSPASGSLAKGQSVTITLTTTGNGPPDFQIALTINPGALMVDVRYPPSG
jgi:RNA polymerase sigma factor (sigma-70 family)